MHREARLSSDELELVRTWVLAEQKTATRQNPAGHWASGFPRAIRLKNPLDARVQISSPVSPKIRRGLCHVQWSGAGIDLGANQTTPETVGA